MAKAKETVREPERYAVIRKGKREESVPAWKYYSIVDLLRDMGCARMLAYDTAKWAGRAADGESRDLGDIHLGIERRLI